MSLRTSAANLAQAAKDLSIDWQQTRAAWHDVKSREFEDRFLDPIPGCIARATVVMEEIDALLRKVRSDCE